MEGSCKSITLETIKLRVKFSVYIIIIVQYKDKPNIPKELITMQIVRFETERILNKIILDPLAQARKPFFCTSLK